MRKRKAWRPRTVSMSTTLSVPTPAGMTPYFTSYSARSPVTNGRTLSNAFVLLTPDSARSSGSVSRKRGGRRTRIEMTGPARRETRALALRPKCNSALSVGRTGRVSDPLVVLNVELIHVGARVDAKAHRHARDLRDGDAVSLRRKKPQFADTRPNSLCEFASGSLQNPERPKNDIALLVDHESDADVAGDVFCAQTFRISWSSIPRSRADAVVDVGGGVRDALDALGKHEGSLREGVRRREGPPPRDPRH